MDNIFGNIKLPRPDRLLQKKLIAISYSLVALTASLVAFIIRPQYIMLFLPLIAVLTLLCLILSLQALKAAEKAINYGGFANKIINQSSNAKRIETFKGKIIIENDNARELFGTKSILLFIKKHLSDKRNNNFAFQQLQNAYANLTPVKLVLALNLNENALSESSWFQISFKTIFLRKTDFFERPFILKQNQKDVFLYWSFRDITAEHNMEKVFQSERASMHDFLDDLPAGLYITDKNYKIEYCNHIFAAKLGFKREEIIGQNLLSYLARNSALPPVNTAWSGFVHFITERGSDLEACVKQESFREDNEIKIRAAVMADLPNDQDIQNRLARSLDEMSWVFDFSPVGIIFTDTKAKIQKCNRKAAEFIGKKADELTENSIFDVIKKSNEYSFTREINSIIAKEKKTSSLEITFSGNDKTATVYITPMQRLYAAQSSPVDGLILYIIDATERKKLESQFTQAQKLQALGQLAGGVAHDFNNLLTAILGFCDLLFQRHGVGDPSYYDLDQVRSNAIRAAHLVRQLLAFSRKQSLQPKYCNVTDSVMELNLFLKRVLGEKITLQFHHGENLGFIRVDPTQFSQVIINLAVNAKDAMNGDGVLTISTRAERLLSPQEFGEEIIKPGDFVVIDVKDTGCGIPPENMGRIFEPFFSTKQNVVGSGTGLGLSTVYGIVRQTGGFIKVESTLNQGTTFSVHLPRFEVNPDMEKTPTPEKPTNITNVDGLKVMEVKKHDKAVLSSANQKFIFGLNVSALDKGIFDDNQQSGIKILFVEDEDSVRNFALRALRKKGYEVVGCNSAENALEHLKVDSDFKLLITDMVMPGMNGVELAAIVKKQIPKIKIILASGYSEDMARNELANSANFEFLAKPFRLGDLTQKIFDVLNRREDEA
ncbi:MAG: response regulator [Alphaproteobacteria bacterium]|nr:response regulator [Alphaproteobacteria bacterium]